MALPYCNLKALSILFLLSFSFDNLPAKYMDSIAPKSIVAMHMLNFTSDKDLEELSAKIPRYAEKGINLLILEIDYSFNFVSHPELRDKDKYVTKEGAHKFAQVCKENHIRIVPEFQCLGHQSWAQYTFPLLTVYPELDLTPGAFPNNKNLYCREWDPTNPKVNQIVFPLIDEIVDAFHADGIHVGMDEVFLLGSEKSPATIGKDPAELYAKVVNELHDHFVNKRKLQMFMWGDRLIDGKKIPGYGSWEASINGTAPAVDKIPKDIVICDWHYRPGTAYPSIPYFIEKGFSVLPCSYKDSLAAKVLVEYSLRQDNPKMLGHMFTTWGGISKDSLLLYSAFTEGMKVVKDRKVWPTAIELTSANTDATLTISISTDKKELAIYYTTDGREPDQHSKKYLDPFVLKESSIVKAVTYYRDAPAGEVASKPFIIHKAIGKSVQITNEVDYLPAKGSTVLVDGIASSNSFTDGQWVGFEGKDIEIKIDFKDPKEITKISFHCFHDSKNWIYPANSAQIWISGDGIHYTKAGETKVEQNASSYEVPVTITFDKTKTNFVKLIIPQRKIPMGARQGAGEPAMIFIDELIVD